MCDMLYFRTKPDSVFFTFLDCALQNELKDIQRISSSDDKETWQIGYPELERLFTPYSVVITLETLIKAHHAPQVYQVTDYHWLLLYNCLKNYCVFHNDMLAETSACFRELGGVRFGVMDLEAMTDRYFWDQEFWELLYVSPSEPGVTYGCECAETEFLDFSYGLRPHPSSLKLSLVQDKAWYIPDPQECGQWRLP